MLASCWDELEFFQSQEWRDIQEVMDSNDGKYSPKRELLFAALDACPLEQTKVVILGQDPYPAADLCTGLAFSIPEWKQWQSFPPTLVNIFKEYCKDLHYPFPSSGDLTPWTKQGVLLLNESLTLNLDVNWSNLIREIIQVVDARAAVFVFLGARARQYSFLVEENPSIELAHPSPLASKAKNPFLGSRIFTTINQKLVEEGLTPIDWRLPHGMLR